jgi:hypothetical protein
MGGWTILPILLWAIFVSWTPFSSARGVVEPPFAYLQWNSSSTTPACDNCPAGHSAQAPGAVCSTDSAFWEAGVHKFKDPIPVGHKLLYVRVPDVPEFSSRTFLQVPRSLRCPL